MKLKKNKDQSVDTVPLLRIGNKTPMEGITEFLFKILERAFEVARQMRQLLTNQTTRILSLSHVLERDNQAVL